MQQRETAEQILDKNLLENPIVSDNALKVLKDRYLAKDDHGVTYEDPKDMYIRVATAIAMAELPSKRKEVATEFYNIMARNEFMPNSPTLMNAGRRLGMLSACFVLPVEDDLNEIFNSVHAVAMVQRAGGGTGFNFSNLRPSNSIVKSSGGTTAGPLSFIDVFSQTTNTIQQGAFRRGANMGIMDIDHPDVISFIKAKEDLKRWQNYNVSIAIDDDWMSTLTVNPNGIHEVYHEETGPGRLYYNKNTKEVKAFYISKENYGKSYAPDDWAPWTVQQTWDLICERAWTTGEPGLFFIDRANENNPVPSLGKITATNPCGEQPLHAYDSCNLGSINLSKFYHASKKDKFDFDRFAKTVHVAVRFLDNVIACNKFPIPEIEEMSRKTRRIGLGVMGFADLLFQLEIPYNSTQALDWAEKLGKALRAEADYASEQLGKEKGNYGAYTDSADQRAGRYMRNAYRTTVAPTGTISIIADCSGGIEPLFALAFKRTVMPDANGMFKVMHEENKHWKEWFDKHIGKDNELKQHVLDNGSVGHFSIRGGSVVEQAKKIFVTSHEIAPLDHVNMQAAWQKHIDTAISKTINLTNNSTPTDVSNAYKHAFATNCKGITVYRDGCRNNVEGMKQPMSIEKKQEVIEVKQPEKQLDLFTDVLPSFRTQVKTQFGTLHLHVVLDEQGKSEREIFAQLGKAGDLIAADLEAICRLASLALRNGASISQVIDQLKDIGTTHIMPSADGKIVSMPDALAKGLKKYVGFRLGNSVGGTTVQQPSTNKRNGKDRTTEAYGIKCPACDIGKLSFQEGCQKCQSCGYSAC